MMITGGFKQAGFIFFSDYYLQVRRINKETTVYRTVRRVLLEEENETRGKPVSFSSYSIPDPSIMIFVAFYLFAPSCLIQQVK